MLTEDKYTQFLGDCSLDIQMTIGDYFQMPDENQDIVSKLVACSPSMIDWCNIYAMFVLIWPHEVGIIYQLNEQILASAQQSNLQDYLLWNKLALIHKELAAELKKALDEAIASTKALAAKQDELSAQLEEMNAKKH